MNNEENPPQNESNDPVATAQQVVEIDKRLTDNISKIQEILGLIVEDKLSLDSLKGLIKQDLEGMIGDDIIQADE